MAWITLNRPARHNRFEAADIATMSSILSDAAARREVRVVVITAHGPSFSSGFDLTALAGPDAAGLTSRFAEMCDHLEALEVPTICGLNGDVYGGATDLALAADFRIGAEGCRLQMSPARLGIEFYYSGLRRFVERLGLVAAKRLFLTGEQIDTATMQRIGFLDEICAGEDLEARLGALAGSLAERSPRSLRGLKQSLEAIHRGKAEPAFVNERFIESLSCADAREGLAARSEGRPPNFADA
ncbi:MAG: enoyl-CoA hydratase/isomerase family protein [Novosphingobium sp.]|nr:enoyl-CoA hydratase/isomerase family protein [Novosphingobium sp.]